MKIDQEFKNLIPPLTDEEYKQLEDTIIKDGCRDELIIWNDTLVDGHNRYKICIENNISYKTLAKEFKNREEVIKWIIINQFMRRDLLDYSRAKLAYKLQDIICEGSTKNQNGDKCGVLLMTNSAKANNLINTRKELARIAGMGSNNLSRVKIIEREATTEQKEELVKGTKSINKVFKELGHGLPLKNKNKEDKKEEDRKTCTSCGKNKSKDEFYKDRSVCKLCHNGSKRNKDFRGNAIRSDAAISNELVNKVCEELTVDKSKVVITTEDLISDLECFSNSFIRSIERCVNDYSVKINKADNKRIIAILLKIKNNTNKFEGVFTHE